MTPTLPLVVPIPDSYWVIPGRLLAGEYPGHKDEAQTLVKLRRFSEVGVTLFFDLTEGGIARTGTVACKQTGASVGGRCTSAIKIPPWRCRRKCSSTLPPSPLRRPYSPGRAAYR
jgi:hypothetical protein